MTTDFKSKDGLDIPWLPVFAALFLLTVFIIAYFDSLRVLFILWLGLDEVKDNSGLLAIACSIYLLVLKKDELKNIQKQPNILAGFALLAVSLIWFIAISVDIQSAHLAILPFIILAMITFLFGYSTLKITVGPILIILFVIPIWWPLLPYLREITTNVTHFSLELINRPVFVQGFTIQLPGGTFIIDESCAGLRFLLVTSLLSFVCKEMFSLSIKKTILLLSVGLFLALSANWIRVLVIVLVGDFTRMQHGLVADHASLGWVIYGIVVLLPFFLLNHFLSANQELKIKGVTNNSKSPFDRKKYVVVVSICFLLMVSGPFLWENFKEQDASLSIIEAPLAIEPVNLLNTYSNFNKTKWSPQYENASQYLGARYELAGSYIDAFFVHYQSQTQGAELINVNNEITDGSLWIEQSETSTVVDFRINNDENWKVKSLELRSRDDSRILVWYWYSVGGLHSNSDFGAKIFQTFGLFTGRSDATLVSISMDCGTDCSDAAGNLMDFVKVMYPSLLQM